MKYFVGNKSLFKDDNIVNINIERAYNILKDSQILSLDLETTRKYNKYGDIEGLDPYTSKIVMFQLGNDKDQIIVDARYNHPKKLLELLTDKNIIIVGQNLKFEYKHLLHNYGIRINNLYDTMIAEMILTTGLSGVSVSLESLIKFYLKIQVNKVTRLEFLTIKDATFSLRQLYYGYDDIIYPLKIRELQLERLKNENLLEVLKLESSFIRVLAEKEYNGLNFNIEKWISTANRNKGLMQNQIKTLDNFITKNYAFNFNFVSNQIDLFNPDLKCKIMWTSSKQVQQFFKHLNMCPLVDNKVKNKNTGQITIKKKYTVEAKELKASLKGENKDLPEKIKNFIEDYIIYKEYEKMVGTYGEAFFKYINPITNRLHSNFKQILLTGRISSSNPNLQQIPQSEAKEYDKNEAKRYMFRYAFDSPEGKDIINCDYAGQETYIMADKSQEKNLLHLLKTGGDSHAFVAKAIDPSIANLSDDDIKKYHSDKRQTAKSANFAIQFGGTGYTIAQNLGITSEEGDEVYNAYFKAFPDLHKYFEKVKSETKQRGYVLINNVTGRKSYFDKAVKSHDRDKRSLNAPVQGTAADMTKLAAIYFFKWIEDNNLFDKIKLTLLIHDEIMAECDKDMSKLVAAKVSECMVKAGKVFCKNIDLKADAAIVSFWKH